MLFSSCSYANVWEYLQLLDTLSTDAARIVDKIPTNFPHVGLTHAGLPNARIIHIQRNPIDTCLSIYFQNFNHTHPYAIDQKYLAHFYDEYRQPLQVKQKISKSSVAR